MGESYAWAFSLQIMSESEEARAKASHVDRRDHKQIRDFGPAVENQSRLPRLAFIASVKAENLR